MRKLDGEAWLRQYYPLPAQGVLAKDAVAHSLHKWRGLRTKVLERYGLKVYGVNVQEKDSPETLLVIGGESCALCHHDHRRDTETRCTKCPLFKVLGMPCGVSGQPYPVWIDEADPEPMIKALKKAGRL